MEIGLDQHGELVGDISSAASKELAIEQVHMRNTCIHVCIQSDIENCEGWLSPGGHSSGGRALAAKVRGPRFKWLLVFHGSLKIFPSLSSCT